MKKLLVLVAALAFASLAAAQQYKWTDQNGRVQYGDTPPPGVKATALRPPPGPSSSSAPKADAKGAPAAKGPMTPAEREADFRKRQADAQKAQEKGAREAKDEQARQTNCQNSRQQLAELESGQRIARTGTNGERYYLEDDQRAVEVNRARQLVIEWCK
jgi:hypothetical protein